MITNLVLIFLACFSSILSIGLHILIWRYRATTPTTKVLFIILVTATLVQHLMFLMGSLINEWQINLFEILVMLSVSLAIVAAYIASYPAIQADSPTFLISKLISKSGKTGISEEDLYSQLNQASLVEDRIADLVADGLVENKSGILVISTAGVTICRIFIFWRKILKEEKGG